MSSGRSSSTWMRKCWSPKALGDHRAKRYGSGVCSTRQPLDDFVWAVSSAARQQRCLSGKRAGPVEVRRRGHCRGGSGGRDANLHAYGRAIAASRRQVLMPIKQDCPLRAAEEVV